MEHYKPGFSLKRGGPVVRVWDVVFVVAVVLEPAFCVLEVVTSRRTGLLSVDLGMEGEGERREEGER